jgi:hypothetical protein
VEEPHTSVHSKKEHVIKRASVAVNMAGVVEVLTFVMNHMCFQMIVPAAQPVETQAILQVQLQLTHSHHLIAIVIVLFMAIRILKCGIVA